MADNRTPNQAANMEKTAGDRADHGEGGGITNRPLDEEIENQEALPERGRSRKGRQEDGLGAGRDLDREERMERERREDREDREDIIDRDERRRDLTPRRYDEKNPTDATMPSNDATLRTEI